MNIILIGMRGSGKSTIGLKLAEMLIRPLIETDTQIEEKVQLSISQIIAKWGWEKFRYLETDIIRDITQLDNVIISTGGGVILKEENIRMLKNNGICIYLTASIDTLYNRIKNDLNRPFLTGAKTIKEDVKKTFHDRKNLYESAADFTILTDQHQLADTAQRIKNFLKTKGVS